MRQNWLALLLLLLSVGLPDPAAAQYTVPFSVYAGTAAAGFSFDAQCSASGVSCSATASTSGDVAAIFCRSSYFSSYTMTVGTSPSVTVTASPSGSKNFDGSFDVHTDAFYALSLPSGSVTYTCQGTGASNNPAILVLLFKAPPTAAFDTSAADLHSSSSSSFTSSTFSTAARGLVVQFVTAIGGTVSAGNIGSVSATLGATASDGPNSSEYVFFSGAQSGITATFSNSNSVGWSGATLAFKY